MRLKEQEYRPLTFFDVMVILRQQWLLFGLMAFGIWTAIAYSHFSKKQYHKLTSKLTVGYFHPVSRDGSIGSPKPLQEPALLANELMAEFGRQEPQAAALVRAEVLKTSSAVNPIVIELTVHGETPDLVARTFKKIEDIVLAKHNGQLQQISDDVTEEIGETKRRTKFLRSPLKRLWNELSIDGNTPLHLARVLELQATFDQLVTHTRALEKSQTPPYVLNSFFSTPITTSSFLVKKLVSNLIIGLGFALLISGFLTVAFISIKNRHLQLAPVQ